MSETKVIYENANGKIIHGDNLEVMKTLPDQSIDSCISDFPYFIQFMKNWDKARNVYQWCYPRALELLRLMKPGGLVCIFGHHKTNHHLKTAFEDAGFNIVEEIDWLFCTGMPKNQDIGKMFDAKAGAQREVERKGKSHVTGEKDSNSWSSGYKMDYDITLPSTTNAIKWDGWKTVGLKPSKEIIMVFQKPMKGTYIQNITEHNCGAMNIDACRVPMTTVDEAMVKAKMSINPIAPKTTSIYGSFNNNKSNPPHTKGRFPPNILMSEEMAQELDQQTGITKSSGGQTDSAFRPDSLIYRTGESNKKSENGGYGDIGGMSKMFPIFKYCPKTSPAERLLPNGQRNPHVTLKPLKLIQWLIKLVTPLDGNTLDITAGSCTHGVAAEKLNQDEGYNLKWINIELMNTEEEPYCTIGKQRVEDICNDKA